MGFPVQKMSRERGVYSGVPDKENVGSSILFYYYVRYFLENMSLHKTPMLHFREVVLGVKRIY